MLVQPRCINLLLPITLHMTDVGRLRGPYKPYHLIIQLRMIIHPVVLVEINPSSGGSVFCMRIYQVADLRLPVFK